MFMVRIKKLIWRRYFKRLQISLGVEAQQGCICYLEKKKEKEKEKIKDHTLFVFEYWIRFQNSAQLWRVIIKTKQKQNKTVFADDSVFSNILHYLAITWFLVLFCSYLSLTHELVAPVMFHICRTIRNIFEVSNF